MYEQDQENDAQQPKSRQDNTELPLDVRRTIEHRRLQGELAEISQEGKTSFEHALTMKELAADLLDLEKSPENYFGSCDARKLFRYALSDEGARRLSPHVFGAVCNILSAEPRHCQSIIQELPRLDPERKLVAIDSLGGKKQALHDYLNDERIGIRIATVGALEEIESFRKEQEAQKEKQILQYLNTGQEEELIKSLERVRFELIERLHLNGDLTDKLLHLLVDENLSEEQSRVIAVFLIGNKDATDTLLDYLEDEDPKVETQAADAAVALFGEKRATDALIKVARGANPFAAREAISSLQGAPEAEFVLREALINPDPELAFRAAKALAWNQRVTSALCRALDYNCGNEEENEKVRVAAARALRGNDRATARLIETMLDSDQAIKVCIAATQALRGRKDAEFELGEVLSTGRSELQRAAASSLKQSERPAPRLISCLSSTDATLSLAAAESLQGLDIATDRAIELLENGRTSSKIAAVRALKGNRRATSALVECLNSGLSELRAEALRSLKHEPQLGTILWQRFRPEL